MFPVGSFVSMAMTHKFIVESWGGGGFLNTGVFLEPSGVGLLLRILSSLSLMDLVLLLRLSSPLVVLVHCLLMAKILALVALPPFFSD